MAEKKIGQLRAELAGDVGKWISDWGRVESQANSTRRAIEAAQTAANRGAGGGGGFTGGAGAGTGGAGGVFGANAASIATQAQAQKSLSERIEESMRKATDSHIAYQTMADKLFSVGKNSREVGAALETMGAKRGEITSIVREYENLNKVTTNYLAEARAGISIVGGFGGSFSPLPQLLSATSGGLLTATTAGIAFAAMAAVGTVEMVKWGSELQQSEARLAAWGNIGETEARRVATAFGTTSASIFSLPERISALQHVVPILEGIGVASSDVAKQQMFMASAEDLAAASGQKLDVSSMALAETMRTFAIPVEQSAHAASVMLGVFERTGVGLQQQADVAGRFQERLGGVAPTIEETAAVFDLLAVAGVRSQRGLGAAENGLQNLVSGSVEVRTELNRLGVQAYNLDGTMRPLYQILIDISAAEQGMTLQEQQHANSILFTKTQQEAYTGVLRQGPVAMQAMLAKEEEANNVHKTAQTATANLRDDISKLGNQASATGALFAGPFVAGLDAGIKKLTDFLALWNKVSSPGSQGQAPLGVGPMGLGLVFGALQGRTPDQIAAGQTPLGSMTPEQRALNAPRNTYHTEETPYSGRTGDNVQNLQQYQIAEQQAQAQGLIIRAQDAEKEGWVEIGQIFREVAKAVIAGDTERVKSLEATANVALQMAQREQAARRQVADAQHAAAMDALSDQKILMQAEEYIAANQGRLSEEQLSRIRNASQLQQAQAQFQVDTVRKAQELQSRAGIALAGGNPIQAIGLAAAAEEMRKGNRALAEEIERQTNLVDQWYRAQYQAAQAALTAWNEYNQARTHGEAILLSYLDAANEAENQHDHQRAEGLRTLGRLYQEEYNRRVQVVRDAEDQIGHYLDSLASGKNAAATGALQAASLTAAGAPREVIEANNRFYAQQQRDIERLDTLQEKYAQNVMRRDSAILSEQRILAAGYAEALQHMAEGDMYAAEKSIRAAEIRQTSFNQQKAEIDRNSAGMRGEAVSALGFPDPESSKQALSYTVSLLNSTNELGYAFQRQAQDVLNAKQALQQAQETGSAFGLSTEQWRKIYNNATETLNRSGAALMQNDTELGRMKIQLGETAVQGEALAEALGVDKIQSSAEKIRDLSVFLGTVAANAQTASAALKEMLNQPTQAELQGNASLAMINLQEAQAEAGKPERARERIGRRFERTKGVLQSEIAVETASRDVLGAQNTVSGGAPTLGDLQGLVGQAQGAYGRQGYIRPLPGTSTYNGSMTMAGTAYPPSVLVPPIIPPAGPGGLTGPLTQTQAEAQASLQYSFGNGYDIPQKIVDALTKINTVDVQTLMVNSLSVLQPLTGAFAPPSQPPNNSAAILNQLSTLNPQGVLVPPSGPGGGVTPSGGLGTNERATQIKQFGVAWAKSQGMDDAFAQKVGSALLYSGLAESGLSDQVNPVSGAAGPFQFTPTGGHAKIAAGMGLTNYGDLQTQLATLAQGPYLKNAAMMLSGTQGMGITEANSFWNELLAPGFTGEWGINARMQKNPGELPGLLSQSLGYGVPSLAGLLPGGRPAVAGQYGGSLPTGNGVDERAAYETQFAATHPGAYWLSPDFHPPGSATSSTTPYGRNYDPNAAEPQPDRWIRPVGWSPGGNAGMLPGDEAFNRGGGAKANIYTTVNVGPKTLKEEYDRANLEDARIFVSVP